MLKSWGSVVQAEGSSNAKVVQAVWARTFHSWMDQENQGQKSMERRQKGGEGLVFQSFIG